MNYPSDPDFAKHSENLASVSAALTQFERLHKRAIREGDEPAEMALRRSHVLLVGVFAEARLRKIITDPTGFNVRERQLIWSKRSQDERWQAAVDFAVRRSYQVLMHEELSPRVPEPALSRVQTVLSLLRDDLGPTVTDRNKLAHGQWKWQLKSGSEAAFLSDPLTLNYNYVAIKARHNILEWIAQLVHILCVSEPTFSRDFAHVTERNESARADLSGAGYEAFRTELQRRKRPTAPFDARPSSA